MRPWPSRADRARVAPRKKTRVSVSQDQVLAALRAVQDPDLHKDIVTLGFVKDVKIAGSEVDFTIELTTPACPVKDQMKAEAEGIVRGLPGVTAARATMTADVKARGGFGRQAVPGIRNIIAVGAGKGGVGKSTTAVNLAVALQRKGARVGLMDADVYGPNTPQMLGIEGGPEVSEAKRMIPPVAFGIKVISMGMLVPADQPIIWRGPMLHGAVQQFMREVEWGELDYLIVDLPPGTGDVSLSMAQSVPVAGAVVVTTPQGVSVSDVRKAVGMFRQLNIPILGVIENMSYFVCGHCQERTEIFGHGGGAKMAEDMGIPMLGQIPIDTRVRSGGDEGRPIVSAAPEAPAAQAFLDIAGRVAAEISKQNMRVLKVIQTA
jgi:ATP-binding protein involved in chromosome partitioning